MLVHPSTCNVHYNGPLHLKIVYISTTNMSGKTCVRFSGVYTDNARFFKHTIIMNLELNCLNKNNNFVSINFKN